jgi:hypothetical protein
MILLSRETTGNFQWGRRGHEQQDQIDQSPFLWIPQRRELHRRYLSLLCPTAAASRTLITLFR